MKTDSLGKMELELKDLENFSLPILQKKMRKCMEENTKDVLIDPLIKLVWVVTTNLNNPLSGSQELFFKTVEE